MPNMDTLISEYFAQQNVTPDFEKEAQVEYFAKLAADNGVDLEKLSEEQVQFLWNETFKVAASDEDEKKKKEEEAAKEHESKKEKAKEEETAKAAAAAAEYAEKRAAAAKLAEAEYIGRYMAHAMTDEIKKIASGQATPPAPAAEPPAAPKTASVRNISALDELAAGRAVEKAAEAQFDPNEAGARINAVLTLGVQESTKIAHVQDLPTAIEVRSLELLEAAGYPVEWPKA